MSFSKGERGALLRERTHDEADAVGRRAGTRDKAPSVSVRGGEDLLDAARRDDAQRPDQTQATHEENLISRIYTTIDSMSESERRITDYLLHHQSAAIGMSQAELARVCGVSAPTVSRFCKRVGERDYHAFQLAFTRASSQMHDGTRRVDAGRDISTDDIRGSLENLLTAKVTDITSTVESLSPDDVRGAVNAIASARVVEVAATGRTLSTALDAAYKFERLGILCTTSMYYEKLLSTAIMLEPTDVLMVISRSGWSGVLQQVVHAAKDQGACVVLITGNRESPLSRAADYVFLATSIDDFLDQHSGNSRVSEMVIVEALYALVASRKPDSDAYLERHYRYVWSEVDLP